MGNIGVISIDLTERQFDTISSLVHELCGINLHVGKKELVKARLTKRLRELEMENFASYIDLISSDAGQAEILTMLDALSTNLTFFFREHAHFDLLRQKVVPEMMLRHAQDRQMRVWSAGCSTGEEAYSIAIALNEVIADPAGWDVRILATDLSTRALEAARKGVYSRERLRDTPAGTIAKYFTWSRSGDAKLYMVNESLRKMVAFARLNLIEPWPMRGPFDAIFCRNVMIYFDKPTQTRLAERFWEMLCPGGIMFIGHSESFTGVQHRFKYVEPTVYRRR